MTDRMAALEAELVRVNKRVRSLELQLAQRRFKRPVLISAFNFIVKNNGNTRT